MSREYTTKELTKYFNKSRQALYKRAEALTDYLSPSANPTKHNKRFFTEEDVQVLQFAHNILERGGSYDDVLLELYQNPPLPVVTIDDGEVLSTIDDNKEARYALDLQRERDEVARLESVIQDLLPRAKKAEELEKKVVELQTIIDNSPSREDIDALHQEIGRLKGIIEYLERK